MAVGRTRHHSGADIWPGFVDALAALLIIVIFLLMVFTLAQYFLNDILTGRDRALDRLNRQVAQLTEMLSLEQAEKSELQASLSRLTLDFGELTAERDRLAGQLAELLPERDMLTNEVAALTAERDALKAASAKTAAELEDAYKTIGADKEKIELQLRRLASLERDIAALREVRDALEKKVAGLEDSLQFRSQEVAEIKAASAKTAAELEDAYKTIGADREKIELQLRRLASLERDIAALREVRGALEKKVAGLEDSLQSRSREVAEIKDSLQDRTRELGALRDRSKELAAELASAEERTRLAQREIDERDVRLRDLGALRDRSKELATELASAEERTRLAQREIDERDVRLRDLGARATRTEEALSAEQAVSAEAQEQVRILNLQIAALRQQLARIEAALQISERKAKEQNVQIVNLSKRLNAALASKVQELASFRSEFFGRLRKALGNRSDVRIVGDRFVFQSEVLFPSGEARLQPGGRVQIDKLAKTIKEIAETIPGDINWVLRVDGHTDRLPISTPAYPSNWELSTGRAIAVVKHLIERGVPATRLAATGFGEFQPIDPGSTIAAFKRNRRIEFKLTQR